MGGLTGGVRVFSPSTQGPQGQRAISGQGSLPLTLWASNFLSSDPKHKLPCFLYLALGSLPSLSVLQLPRRKNPSLAASQPGWKNMAAWKNIAASRVGQPVCGELCQEDQAERPLQSVTPQAFPEFPLATVDFLHSLLYHHLYPSQWNQWLAPLPEILGAWGGKHLMEHCTPLKTVIRRKRPNPKVEAGVEGKMIAPETLKPGIRGGRARRRRI